jgi:hypothetical protein
VFNLRERFAIARLRRRGAIVSVRGGHAIDVSFEECDENVTCDDLRHLSAFQHLERLDLYGTPVDDQFFGFVNKSCLTSLNLNCTTVTDHAIEHISACQRLMFVGLMETKVTDAVVDVISSCQQLSHLRIDGTEITGKGVSRLCGPLPLERIWIDGLQGSAECLVALASLPTLRELNLVGSDVTDATMELLPAFHDLRSLGLVRTAVSDAGLANVMRVGNLEAICLSHSGRLTDEAVTHLKGLDRVRYVWLVGTRVTEVGKDELRASYPTATIGP